MSVADFEKSAEAAAPVIGQATLSVGARIRLAVEATRGAVGHNTNLGIILLAAPLAQAGLTRGRSEEHTSELQSRRDLVCRLLLEKKKTTECPSEYITSERHTAFNLVK